nr:MAG TPA: hypothetical protein [Caudoviricetes sp.]
MWNVNNEMNFCRKNMLLKLYICDMMQSRRW